MEIWKSLLADLTEEQFIRGIKKLCSDHKEIFPGTNIIAHIREYACSYEPSYWSVDLQEEMERDRLKSEAEAVRWSKLTQEEKNKEMWL